MRSIYNLQEAKRFGSKKFQDYPFKCKAIYSLLQSYTAKLKKDSCTLIPLVILKHNGKIEANYQFGSNIKYDDLLFIERRQVLSKILFRYIFPLIGLII